MNAPHSLAPWLQPGDRVGGRGPIRFNRFPAGLGGTGYQPVPLGNLPNGMGSALEHSERALIFIVIAIPSGQWPDGTGW